MKSRSLAVLFLLFAAAEVSGQQGNLNVFLFEKSYAGAGTPSVIGKPSYYDAVAEPDLSAEAQTAVHLPFRRGLTFQELRDGKGWGWNLFLTPQFRLRGLKIASGPVRSISFMPKFTSQWLFARGGNRANTAGRRHVFGLNFILGHHSNGGQTCVFEDEVQDPAQNGKCVSTLNPLPPVETRVTLVNGGNFSTNYIEVGAGYRIGTTDSGGGADHWNWYHEVAVSYQRHHTWFPFPLPGGPAPGFDELYGLHRFRLDLASAIHISAPLALRLGLRIDAFSPSAERFPGSRNYTLESEAFVQLVDGLGATALPRIFSDLVGVGIRYSRGMDYYNTQFVRDISFWQILITVDPWSPKIN